MRGGRSSQTPVSPSSRVAVDAERGERADQRLLEVADVLLHVAAVPLQVEDRVADELARAVEGRLPAAVGLDHLDLRALGHVELRGLVGAPAERHDGRMLEQDDRVGDRALRDGAREGALQLPRLEVRDLAELKEVAAGRHGAQASFRDVAVVLVEGITDRIALEAVAAKLGRDLAAQASRSCRSAARRRSAARPREHEGERVVGLCDAGEERWFRRVLGDATYVCVEDLEDELIRALGPTGCEEVIAAQGELETFRNFQNQLVRRRGRTVRAVELPAAGCRSAHRRNRALSAARSIEALEPERDPLPASTGVARRSPHGAVSRSSPSQPSSRSRRSRRKRPA